MAIIKKETLPPAKRQIDLTGPMGNAFCLIGIARDWGKQMGMSEAELEAMDTEMTSGDYENLVEVFDKHFGSVCDLIR